MTDPQLALWRVALVCALMLPSGCGDASHLPSERQMEQLSLLVELCKDDVTRLQWGNVTIWCKP